MSKKTESIYGSADNSNEEFVYALQNALTSYCSDLVNAIGEYVYCNIQSTFGNTESGSVVFKFYGASEEYKNQSIMVDFSNSKSENEYNFTFSNPRKVSKNVDYSEMEKIDKENYTVSIKTESSPKVLDKERTVPILMLESILTESETGLFEVGGRIKFESGVGTTQKFFDKNGYIKGEVPIVGIDLYTSNGNRYLESFCKKLVEEVNSVVSSKDKKKFIEETSYMWPTLAIYPSHEVSKKTLEGVDSFREICAEITGAHIKDGYVWFKFETWKNGSGTDIAIAMLKGYVSAGSLRILAESQVENEKGGYDVSSGHIEGAGFDWTQRPAMPGVKQKGIKLESSKNKEGEIIVFKNLDDLKADHPELFESLSKRLNSGEDLKALLLEANTSNEVLKKENERLKIESSEHRATLSTVAVDNVIKKFESDLAEEKDLDDDTKKELLESSRSFVVTASKQLLESRPSLSPKTKEFSDTLYSSCDEQFQAKLESVRGIVARLLKKNKLSHTEGRTMVNEGNGGIGTPNLNTMDSRHRLIESERESIGLKTGERYSNGDPIPAPIEDMLLSKVFGGLQVYEDGQHVMSKYMPAKYSAVKRLEQNYMDESFVINRSGGAVTDRMLFESESARTVMHKLNNRIKLEAGELTSSPVMGTLFPQIRSGVLMSVFAMSSWLSFSNLETIESDKYQVWEEEFGHFNDHTFGRSVNGAGTWGALGGTDDTALTYPQRVFAKLTVGTNATAITIVCTGTNQNGVSVICRGTMPAGLTAVALDAGGMDTYIELRPDTVGDKIVDITAVDTVLTTGGTNANEIAFVTWEPVDAASELDVSGKGNLRLVRKEGSVGEMDLRVDLGWRMIEDALKSLAMHGPGAYNSLAAMIRAISLDIASQVDRRGFGAANSSANYDSQNNVTFDVSSGAIPAGYTEEEYKSKLHETLVKWNEKIEDWGDIKPTRMSINRSDTHKLLWMKGDFIKRNVVRAESFYANMAWGTVAGLQVIPAAFQPHNKFLAADPSNVNHFTYIPLEFRGPYFVGQKTDVYIARQRTGDVFTRSRTRGVLSITE